MYSRKTLRVGRFLPIIDRVLFEYIFTNTTCSFVGRNKRAVHHRKLLVAYRWLRLTDRTRDQKRERSVSDPPPPMLLFPVVYVGAKTKQTPSILYTLFWSAFGAR